MGLENEPFIPVKPSIADNNCDNFTVPKTYSEAIEKLHKLHSQTQEQATEIARLRDLIDHDYLIPDIYNKRGFSEHLKAAVNTANRYNLKGFLVLADIDNLKIVNDTYGHPAGDQILISFGLAMSETIRESDIPARLGGDEFALILPIIDQEGTKIVVERIRRTYSQIALARLQEYLHLQISTPFSASFGVTEIKPGCFLEDLIARADKELYREKRAKKETL